MKHGITRTVNRLEDCVDSLAFLASWREEISSLYTHKILPRSLFAWPPGLAAVVPNDADRQPGLRIAVASAKPRGRAACRAAAPVFRLQARRSRYPYECSRQQAGHEPVRARTCTPHNGFFWIATLAWLHWRLAQLATAATTQAVASAGDF